MTASALEPSGSAELDALQPTRQSAAPAARRGPQLSAATLKALLAVGAAAAVALALVGAPTPIILNPPLVAHVAGLFAGYVVAVMLVLMSRTPVLERDIGADRLARWHARGGRVFIVAMLVHIVAATMVWANVGVMPPPNAAVDMLRFPVLIAAIVSGALFVVVAAVSIRAARRKLSYETWHTIHLLTYSAIALSFVHELIGPNFVGHVIVQVAWSLMYAYSFFLVLRYRVLRPLEHRWRHRLRVERVEHEAPGVASIIVRGRFVGELDARPGQFFRWRFITPHSWRSAHPFSLSAPPRGDLLRITVKDLGDGSRLLHTLRPGVRVLAEGPYGAMTADRRRRDSVLLIAGGVGITPMRALFETLEAPRRLTLLYRASSADDIVFRRELDEIAAIRGAEIVWMIGRSSDPQNAMTAHRLTELVPDVAERDVYLCASPALSAAVRTALADAGLPKKHLHEEVFAF